MRWAAIALGTATAVSGCASGGGASGPPAASAAEAPTHFDLYTGAYRSAAGVTYVVNGHGHLARLSDGWFRQMFPSPIPDNLSVGPGFQVKTPTEARVAFTPAAARAQMMTITPHQGQAVTAPRLPFKETEAKVPADGAVLAATITEPLTPGPHPGIVVVHGSGPGPRVDYGLWVGLYASLGLTVLSYDKRGNADSTGRYPGEEASDVNLNIYAADAAACRRFLAAWPGVDARRVGFHGGSQGGWTVPLALQRDPAAAFAVLVSGPAVTTGQQQVWASFSGGSGFVPTASPGEIDTALRSQRDGYDPAPVLATLTAPVLWLNGEVDRQVPTALNAEVLHGLNRPNFDIQVLPLTSHGLLESATGISRDDETASHLAQDVFARIATWLSAHEGTNPAP